MANLQVKNVPEALYKQIKKRAAREGRTMRDFVLEAVRGKLEREAFHARLARRQPVELGRKASVALDEVRAEREAALRG
jgi:plasmid stability protein